ncbi:hypothetical protein ATY81_07990 [Rhizobium sp. R72]|nr:hypothetical protein ATY81_07990 [Rhizobium sp. R72]OWV97709.1 hypothetical protein ATY80_07990 [Rhizobium sp. R711]
MASPEFIAKHGPFDAWIGCSVSPASGRRGVRGEKNFWSQLKPNGGSIDVESSDSVRGVVRHVASP